MIHADYPDAKGVDKWCDSLLAEADSLKFKARVLNQDGYSRVLAPHHNRGNTFVEFTGRSFDTFYGYWQPAYAQTVAPLLIHVPGYGAEMSAHPELVSRGFNVLHVNPQGYMTPEGHDSSKLVDGDWPVPAGCRPHAGAARLPPVAAGCPRGHPVGCRAKLRRRAANRSLRLQSGRRLHAAAGQPAEIAQRPGRGRRRTVPDELPHGVRHEEPGRLPPCP